MERKSGILMPIFALPSKYGMGSFGRESYEFVDYLSFAGQKLWQILPLAQTGFGNSPYSSVSSESINPYFISIDKLKEEGLLTSAETRFAISDGNYIDYGNLYAVRYPLLRSAFSRFDKEDKGFKKFIKSKKAYDYALFMSIKYASGQKNFFEWDYELKYRNPVALKAFEKSYREEILFWQFVQFKGNEQWLALKKYANSKGIKIIGDMPLYVATDSVDVWVNPTLFKLDENLQPKKVAGVPPDYFCEDGQLWGNPVYDYNEHAKDGYLWWCNRVKNALSVYDYLRIDHFRGLDRYFEINQGMDNAKQGEWVDVPSDELFERIHNVVDKSRIIAEDLGIIDDGVRELLKKVGYPGMKVLSFAFNGEQENLYLPENVQENSVCYTGTHDNDTLMGLIENATEWDKNNLVVGVKRSLDKLGIKADVSDNKSLGDAIIKLGFACKSKIFLMPFADVLGYGSDYRINEPGTCKENNWVVRFKKSDFKKSVAIKLRTLTEKYSR